MNTYQIVRGKWYDENFVDPKMKIVDGSPFSNDTFFGLNGSLHMVPTSVLVMYRPTIQITTTTETFRQVFAANAEADINWLDLSGFRFSVDGLASLEPVGDAKTTTVTFKAAPNMAAQVVGVISKNTWNGNEP
jgi:hypothetical protein